MAFVQVVTIVVAGYDPAIAFLVDALGLEVVVDSAAVTNDGPAERAIRQRWTAPDH